MAQSDLTTYICLFHNRDRAEMAVNALENAGFNRNAITSVVSAGEADSLDEELLALGVPSRDLEHLRAGVTHGGVVVSLEAGENRSDEIERIFHKYSAEKIDETESNLPTPVPAVAPVPYADKTDIVAAEGATVPIVAEELIVGKREVDRGGVRVFRRTVEEPVSEELSLHEEHVVVERRPVDRAVTDADFTQANQTIELVETEEVPVVSKVARVVEEVRLGVVESEHTETIKDSVRHTEVEVESVPETSSTTRTGTGQGY